MDKETEDAAAEAVANVIDIGKARAAANPIDAEQVLDSKELFADVMASFDHQKKTGAPDEIALRNALMPLFLAVEILGFPALLALANRLVAQAEKQGRKKPHEAGLSLLLTMSIGGLGMERMPDAQANVALALLGQAAAVAEKEHRVDPRGFVRSKFEGVFGG